MSADAEAATQQLLTESTESFSSASKPVQQAAAVFGASLLNAARIEHRHSSPSAGKLKRPSLFANDPRRNLSRRGDVYDVELSPEKGAFKLPETVNRQPLQVRRKRPARQEHRHGLVDEPLLPSSPPGVATASRHVIESDALHAGMAAVALQERLPGGKPRCAVVLNKHNMNLGPHYQQCSKHGAEETDGGPRCLLHLRKLAAVRCGDLDSDNTAAQCHRRATTETAAGPRCTMHAGTFAAHAVSKRKTRVDHNDELPRKSQKNKRPHVIDLPIIRRSQPQVQIPVRKTTRQTVSDVDQASGPLKSQRATSSVQTAKAQAATAVSKQHPKSSSNESSSNESSDVMEVAPAHGDTNSEDSSADDDRDPEPSAPKTIDTVFAFLELEERHGKCQTESGATIKRLCKTSCSAIEDDSTAFDDVIADNGRILKALKQFGSDVEEADRPAFKSDAYSYLFRHLTVYLRLLYDWLERKSGAVTQSLDAMHIVSSLIRDILSFKDTIANWHVSVPQRYTGDRMIKDVDSRLIVPLREVSVVLQARLSQLRASEQRQKQLAILERQREQEAEEEQRAIAISKRAQRWQNLHVLRMQCEPDPFRRRNLVITPFEDIAETDANGDIFERLPVFRARSSPPSHLISTMSRKREWSDYEAETLLGALEKFAGKSSSPWRYAQCAQSNMSCRIECLRKDLSRTLPARRRFTRLHSCRHSFKDNLGTFSVAEVGSCT